MDPEEQFIISKIMDGVDLPESAKGFTTERALVYSAAMGWPDGIKWSIRAKVNLDYLRVAQAAASMLGAFEPFVNALIETNVKVDMEGVYPVYFTTDEEALRKKMPSYNCDLHSDIPNTATERETFLLGSAIVGWDCGIGLAHTRRGTINMEEVKERDMCFMHWLSPDVWHQENDLLGRAMTIAAKRGNVNSMRTIFDLFTSNDSQKKILDKILENAAVANQTEVMAIAVEMGATDFRSAFTSALLSGSYEGMAAAAELNTDYMLIHAAKWNNATEAHKAMKLGARSHKKAAQVARDGGHYALADTIMNAEEVCPTSQFAEHADGD